MEINIYKLRNKHTKLEIAEMYKSVSLELKRSKEELLKAKEESNRNKEYYYAANNSVEELRKEIEAFKVERIADLKATRMYIEMANSGLTHREKGFIANNLTSIIDKRIEAMKRSYDVHLVRNELPF